MTDQTLQKHTKLLFNKREPSNSYDSEAQPTKLAIDCKLHLILSAPEF